VGNTALVHGILLGRPDLVRLMLRRPDLDVNYPLDGGGNFPRPLNAAAAACVCAAASGQGASEAAAAAAAAAFECFKLLLEDGRTRRGRGLLNKGPYAQPRAKAYDCALRAVKRRRNAMFRGLVRFAVVRQRMQLRVAQMLYAPGRRGYRLAEQRFNAQQRALALKGTNILKYN